MRAMMYLIEKPPTPTVGEMLAMIDVCEKEKARALCGVAFALQ